MIGELGLNRPELMMLVILTSFAGYLAVRKVVVTRKAGKKR